MISQDQLDSYINYNKNRWSETTLKSETSRLKKLIPLYNEYVDSPLELYNSLAADKKPYTIKTSFIRLANLLKYLRIDSPYVNFVKDYANLFKNSYVTEKLDITFAEAEQLIKKIPQKDVQEHALGLLYTGLRSHEVNSIDNEKVLGKGKKYRTVFGKTELLKEDISYQRLYLELKKVGLKPHTLRKLFATRLANNGLKEADLCKVMGWESFRTAERYLQGRNDKELSNIIGGF